MIGKATVLITILLLLSGCWDEEQFRDVTIVSIMGIDTNEQNVDAKFAYTVFQNKQIMFTQSEGQGISTRNARMHANYRTMEELDLSHLEVLLITENIASENMLPYLDMFYRVARNRLGSYLAMVDDDLETFFNPAGDLKSDITIFYPELLRTGVLYTYTPDSTLHLAATSLVDDAIDLALPYLTMGEKGIPEIAGIALFHDKQFTGQILRKQNAIMANIMSGKKGKDTRLSYDWEKGDGVIPVSINIGKIKKKWDIKSNSIHAKYTISAAIEEFPPDGLYKKEEVKKLEAFLAGKMTAEAKEVLAKTQEAKSDIFGFGRHVHAFHTDLWEKGKWNDTFAELPIDVKVEVEVKQAGIIN